MPPALHLPADRRLPPSAAGDFNTHAADWEYQPPGHFHSGRD